MSEEENKELVRRYTREVFDQGGVDAVDRYLAPDFYNHVTGRSGTNPQRSSPVVRFFRCEGRATRLAQPGVTFGGFVPLEPPGLFGRPVAGL